MPNYQNTKIYKIYSPSNEALVYYGHTTELYLSSRLSDHVRHHRRWLNGKRESRVTSYIIFEQCSDYQIILIENFPCNDVNEARARERFHIENNQCLNRNIPGRTPKEYSETYHSNNKEKEQIYRDEHKSEIKQKNHDYYKNNKKTIEADKRQSIICECGATIQKQESARHRRSQKHLSFIAQLK